MENEIAEEGDIYRILRYGGLDDELKKMMWEGRVIIQFALNNKKLDPQSFSLKTHLVIVVELPLPVIYYTVPEAGNLS